MTIFTTEAIFSIPDNWYITNTYIPGGLFVLDNCNGVYCVYASCTQCTGCDSPNSCTECASNNMYYIVDDVTYEARYRCAFMRRYAIARKWSIVTSEDGIGLTEHTPDCVKLPDVNNCNCGGSVLAVATGDIVHDGNITTAVVIRRRVVYRMIIQWDY